MEKTISTLSENDKCISYRIEDGKLYSKWGKTKNVFEMQIIEDILDNFFIDNEKWYMLGSNKTDPIGGGLGEYLLENHEVSSSQFASLIAAIMVNEGLIEAKGKKPIMLKKRV